MSATATVTAAAAEDVNVLRDIVWETYCQLNDENGSPAVRMAFFQGELEIMTVSAGMRTGVPRSRCLSIR